MPTYYNLHDHSQAIKSSKVRSFVRSFKLIDPKSMFTFPASFFAHLVFCQKLFGKTNLEVTKEPGKAREKREREREGKRERGKAREREMERER